MKIMLAIAGAIVLGVIGYILYSQSNGDGDKGSTSQIAKLNDNVLGSADAPVTIIEFSSLTCPHCATFHEETLPGLKSKYIDTGKVKYILKEFPLDPFATAGFMLGRCLEKKEAYFDFIDLLYARQGDWAGAADPEKALLVYAKQAGFTDESFKACIENRTLQAQILAVKNEGSEQYRIRSTPTFFINGTRLEGAQPLSEFEKLIDPLIK